MLAKCANPKCSAVFRYFGAGRLFRLPTGAPCDSSAMPLEHFWLCPDCVNTMTLAVESTGRVVVMNRNMVARFREAGGQVRRVPEVNLAKTKDVPGNLLNDEVAVPRRELT
jgi:hypothetical protein